MGLFSFNYAKPGPGVSKDAPKKKGVFLFFELLGRKFFKLIQATWITCIFSIPYIALMFTFIYFFIGSYFIDSLKILAEQGLMSAENININVVVICSFLTMSIFVLWGSGPASAAFAYITRCFTREEHSWIFSDFISKFKENFKQGIMLVICDFVFLYLFRIAIIYYYRMYVANNHFIWLLLVYLCVIFFMIYTFIHYHIYQIMVTFECKFRDLIKNSMLLAFGKAPLNLLLGIISIGLIYALFSFITPIVASLLILVFFFGLFRYHLEFFSARTILKIMDNRPEED